MIFKRLINLLTPKEIPVSPRKLQEITRENKKEGERLSQIAHINNSGIELEKAGDINEAIKKYEENVGNKVVATHSYERLMILYRKRKQYREEIEVLKTAIEIFSDENDRRYKRALSQRGTAF